MNELLIAYGKLTRGEIKAINAAAGKDIFTSIEIDKKTCKTYVELRALSIKSVFDFLSDYKTDDVINVITRDLYRKYVEYCDKNNIKPISNVEFSKYVKNHFGIDIITKKINGVCRRVFVR